MPDRVTSELELGFMFKTRIKVFLKGRLKRGSNKLYSFLLKEMEIASAQRAGD